MQHIDVFNGDADGICSLIQLRLAAPQSSVLITGVKRDIQLLDRVTANAGDQVTVLDISMEKNASALNRLCQAGVQVFYADHHRSGEIPSFGNLQAHINPAANTCTGLIIDNYLQGQFRDWAIVAAFGDNLTAIAEELCRLQNYSTEQVELLRQLGTAFNYNGYGDHLDDLWFTPDTLYRMAVEYRGPFEFINDQDACFSQLTLGYQQDLAKGLAAEFLYQTAALAIIELPDTAWARRISGVLGNELANRFPDRAHAICTANNRQQSYTVSLRAAKTNPTGAVDIAAQFGGGGRVAAAGINPLAMNDLPRLIRAMDAEWGS